MSPIIRRVIVKRAVSGGRSAIVIPQSPSELELDPFWKKSLIRPLHRCEFESRQQESAGRVLRQLCLQREIQFNLDCFDARLRTIHSYKSKSEQSNHGAVRRPESETDLRVWPKFTWMSSNRETKHFVF